LVVQKRMSLRIYSSWRGAAESPYARMARVLSYSARRFHESVDVACLDTEFRGTRSDAFVMKAADWTFRLNEESAGNTLALLDTDVFLQHPLSPVLGLDFDIAVTTHGAKWLNSGVVFARPSERVRRFFAPWAARTAEWCKRNTQDRIRFGDQDALIQMLHDAPAGLRILRLEMREWNSTQRTWHLGLSSTRIVHFKSDARKCVFNSVVPTARGREVAKRWLSLETEALS
jgi:hypothetical protein